MTIEKKEHVCFKCSKVCGWHRKAYENKCWDSETSSFLKHDTFPSQREFLFPSATVSFKTQRPMNALSRTNRNHSLIHLFFHPSHQTLSSPFFSSPSLESSFPLKTRPPSRPLVLETFFSRSDSGRSSTYPGARVCGEKSNV